MFISLVYVFSAIGLMVSFYFFPKTSKTQNAFIWIPFTYLAYEAFVCFIGAVLSLFKLPANIPTIALFNIFLLIYFLYSIKKSNKQQSYNFAKIDILFFIFLSLTVLFLAQKQFGNNFTINYATSDPAVHLKMAMDCVNGNTIYSDQSLGMCITPFTNALFIETLMPLFKGAYVYKSFIIKDVINFWILSFIFYANLRSYITNRLSSVIVLIFSFIFLFGYPYNNILFGFFHLGVSIQYMLFISLSVYFYMNSDISSKLILPLLSLGCLASVLSYTLFSPIIFISVLCCVFKKLQIAHALTLKKFIYNSLFVFLVPTFFAIIYIVFPVIFKTSHLASNSLLAEGYIYRNLYSDFILYASFAIYGYYKIIRSKIYTFFRFFTPILFVFQFALFICMLNNIVSTYYYYKINFMIWPTILILASIGLIELSKKSLSFVLITCANWVAIFLVFITNFDGILNAKNVQFSPFVDSKSTFQIFYFNGIISNTSGAISTDLVNLSQETLNIREKTGDEDTILFVGSWLENYWFEALVNQRQSNEDYLFTDPLKAYQKYLNHEVSPYIVVIRNSEEHLQIASSVDELPRVYENDYGYIAILP